MAENRPVSHTKELRQLLANTIQQVQAGQIAAADAKAIAALSGEIINAARFDLELLEAASEYGPLPLEPIIGAIEGPPQQLVITKRDNTELLREKLVALLSDRGRLPIKDIARELKIPSKQVQMVLDHEWFEKTPDGYRMAET